MKATIKVVTARRSLSPDQKDILRRVANVLREHDFSVRIVTKETKVKTLKLKAV